jgi:hypothetical protein
MKTVSYANVSLSLALYSFSLSIETYPVRRRILTSWLLLSLFLPSSTDTLIIHMIKTLFNVCVGSRVSSGSIVSVYGLDDRAIGVRSPAGANDFSSSVFVQTGSGAHPASCTMGTGGPFSGGKARPRRDADHSPPSSAEVGNE